MELQRFITNCSRVLKVTKKPNRSEFRDLVKITGLGILVIGVIGFVVQLITTLIK